MNLANTLFAAAVLSVGVTGCVTVQGGNGAAMGTFYSSYKMGGNIGSGQGGSKTGQACATSIMGVAAYGDASVAAAKQAGGIATVSHVDHDLYNVLGIYAKTCTVVVGD